MTKNLSRDFVDVLLSNGVSASFGVPDSLLGALCDELLAEASPITTVITANEGLAVSAAIGDYLSTGDIPLVFFQNSGLGNAVNPLTSIAAPQVYSIPMVLLIGWRGEESVSGSPCDDEPQHCFMGNATKSILNALQIPFFILSQLNFAQQVKSAIHLSFRIGGPVAILVRKGTFAKVRSRSQSLQFTEHGYKRSLVVNSLVSELDPADLVVSTTGYISREFLNFSGSSKPVFFPNFGGMGHAAMIAYGLAKRLKDRRVVCIDGDGSLLMHFGGSPLVAECENIVHVVLNNHCHDSVGGQPTAVGGASLTSIARGMGYKAVFPTESSECDLGMLGYWMSRRVSTFIELPIEPEEGEHLPRPNQALQEIRNSFMQSIRNPNQ